jgi:hypothetical protein
MGAGYEADREERMNGLKDYFAQLLEREAARVTTAAAAAATAAALALAAQLGVELTPEVVAAAAAIAAFVANEVIRRLVYSIRTTQAIADRAAATGDTDIGKPPEGPVANP